MAAGVGRLVNQNRTTPRAEDVDVGREKASARSHRSVSLRCSTSERAREQPADAPHNSSAAQYPRTNSLRTTQHTRHRHERAGLRIAHWRPFLLGRGLSTHPIACCNPVTDPNPQPSSASHFIHPSHLLCFARQGETMSDAPTQSDFVQIVTFAFRRATLV